MTDDDVFPDRHLGHLEKLTWMIEQRGWAIEAVPAVNDPVAPRPAYAYTVGIEPLLGHPEIAILGLAPAAAAGLLELVVGHLAGGGQLPIGAEFVGLLDGEQRQAVVEVDLDEHRDRFPAAVEFHAGEPFRMVQFVWPDRAGRLPWDADYDERLRLAQPVLSAPTDPTAGSA